MNEKTHLKNHIVKSLIKHGKKSVIEKNLLKTFKKLGENSNRPIKNLIKTHFFFLLPIFKINKKKKKTLLFLWTLKAKLSLAMKLFTTQLKDGKSEPLYKKLYREIYSINLNNNKTTELKNKIQKQILLTKNFFFYYKWR